MSFNVDLNKLGNAERTAVLAGLRKPLLNTKAVFSDETANFRRPVEPERGECVEVSLRAAKNNIDKAVIHFYYENNGENNGQKSCTADMTKIRSDYYFDYYGYTLGESVPNLADISKIVYYFEIQKDGESFYYSKQGIVRRVDMHYSFSVIFGFKTPDWAKGAVMYQIFTDRFNNGDPKNDVVNNEYIYLGKPAMKVDNWSQPPGADDVRSFYGGDLQGVIDKLDYLKELGVDAVYFNPLFVSPSNHKYDAQDYDYIDPHYGVIIEDGGSPLKFEKFRNKYATMYMERTCNKKNLEASNALMARLIKLAHEKGMKVIIDGVFNHCGAFNKWLDREGFYALAGEENAGAYRDKNSPYNAYFNWFEDRWPNNDAYDSWWGHDNHPKLNYEGSKKLYDYMLEVARKWVSPPYNADGWRLDVAADLGRSREMNHKFWRDFRTAVKSANPDAIVLGEHYGRADEWLKGDEWDTIMNYDAFMEPLSWFLTGMEKHSEEYRGDLLNNGWVFEQTMRYNMAYMNAQSLSTAMNQLSNHDHSRFLTRTNRTVGRLHTKGAQAASEGINKAVFYEAVTFMFTWVGSPCIYYGDEAGLCGWTDPDNRRTYPWGAEDRDLLRFHKELAALRNRYPALRHGSLDYIFMDYGLICFGRWDENDKIVVILNNDERERQLTAPVWKIGVSINTTMEQLIHTGRSGFVMGKRSFPVKNGKLTISLPPFSSFVLIEK